jgi:hypothetical protein
MKLKVFVNKRNGQPAVHLPKKYFTKIPPYINLKIPKKFIKTGSGK